MISVFLTCPHQPQGGSITPSSRQTEKNSTSTFPLSDSVRFFDISHFSWRTTNVCLWVLGYYIYVSRCVFLHHFCSNVHCFFNCDHRWTCHIHTHTSSFWSSCYFGKKNQSNFLSFCFRGFLHVEGTINMSDVRMLTIQHLFAGTSGVSINCDAWFDSMTTFDQLV